MVTHSLDFTITTINTTLRVYLPLLNVDKDILFLLAIRKREHEVSINSQSTHGDQILSSVCKDTVADLCALQFIESSGPGCSKPRLN